MFCTIINDCLDPNAVGRQGSRLASLLGVTPTFVGVGGRLQEDNRLDVAEVEAAGCLVDVLDSAEGRKGVVLVNVANRHAKGKRWPNGTPFGYFRYGETIVVSSVDGIVLSLAQKMGITDRIALVDVGEVMNFFANEGVVSKEVAEHTTLTQFRSFDFTPRVGAYLATHQDVPHEDILLAEADFVEELPKCVWFVDNFGNVKTTVLPEEIGFAAGKLVATKYGEIACFDRLKDVPNDAKALIVGSSGIGEKRFVELVVQGKSAKEVFGLQVGEVLITD